MPYKTVKAQNIENIKKVISSNSGIGFEELLKKADVSRPTLSDHLSELEEDGKIVQKDDENNKKKVHYYLSKNERKKPKMQATFCCGLFYELIEKSVDPKPLYKELKDKKEPKIYDLLNQTIDEPLLGSTKDKYDILSAYLKEPDDSYLTLLKTIAYWHSPEDDIKEKSKEEISKILTNWYLASGPLLNLKKSRAVKIIITELTDRMIFTEEQKELYTRIINQIADPEYQSAWFYIKPQEDHEAEEISEEEKDKIIEGVDKILSMGLEERYQEYLEVDLRTIDPSLPDEKKHVPFVSWDTNTRSWVRLIESQLSMPSGVWVKIKESVENTRDNGACQTLRDRWPPIWELIPEK